MAMDGNEATAHRWHLEAIQQGKPELVSEIMTPDVVVHVNGQEFRGTDQARALAQGLKTAFPEARITHHDAFAGGNRVAIRWSTDATHGGDYFGVPASGQPVHLEGLDWFEMRDGKIAQAWIAFDNLGVMQQIGAIPRTAGAQSG